MVAAEYSDPTGATRWLLRQATRLLAPVLDRAPVGFAVLDAGLRYLYVNRALADLHGLPVAGHLGRTAAQVAGQADPVVPGLPEVVATGAVHRDVELDLVVSGRPRHFLVNRFPLLDERGAVLAVSVVVQDLTEAHRLAALEHERAARRLRSEWTGRLEQAQQLGGVGSWDVDLRTGEVSWSANMCRIAGLPGSPRTVDDVLALMHPEDLDRARAYYDDLVAGAPAAGAEFRLVRPDGGQLVVSSTAEVVTDASGVVAGLRGVCVDRTAQRQVEQEAREARVRAELAGAELLAEQQVVLRLQRALLPPRIPRVGGVELAVAYQPSDRAAGVGGDFYDAFLLPDGRLGIAVGDVVGHDVEAAVTMGRVRNAIRAYAVEAPGPGRLLGALNRLVHRDPDLALTTAFYGVYTPGTGELAHANAGHPHPLLRREGVVSELAHRHGLMLGVEPTARYATRRVTLRPDDVLLCFTDGLVEHRDLDLDRGVEALRDALAAPGPRDLDHLVRRLIAEVAPHEGRDDICVLALRRGPAGSAG